MWKAIKIILLVLCMTASAVVGAYAGRITVTVEKADEWMHVDVDTDFDDIDLGDIKVKSDNDIINILLIGNDEREESSMGTVGGLSDVMIIGTLDLKHKRLKLSSLLRDCYVDIPGYGSNKLNAAYPLGGGKDGGVKLLYQTIAYNFGIKLDGYVEVGFDAFVKVVNDVGGVDIELSESEAEYLNTTNYISKKKYRNVKPGWNHMNGYQALGYCRIRKGCTTIDGQTDDYARTFRQRTTISAGFKQLKQMPMSKWLKVVEDVSKEIRTDLKIKEITGYLSDVVAMGTTEIDTLQIPLQNHFYGEMTSNAGSALIMNTMQDNASGLHEFIFDYNGKGEFKYSEVPSVSVGAYNSAYTDTTGTTQ
ncbi:MAG: LCP family protein [Lachnospiraceae bacterium]|nr:LCP family protein [Lachnospiraceae bacterium]